MKKLLLCVYPLLLYFSCFSQNTNKLIEHFQYAPTKPLWVMAHRGILSDEYPENSIEGFEASSRFASDIIIEFDVRITKDSVMVLLHDDSLSRTTTGRGLLINQTWKDVQDLGLITNTQRPTTYKIPRFDQVLQWARTKNNILAIDAKPGADRRKIARMILDNGLLQKCFIICYSVNDAATYLSMNKNFMLAIGIGSISDMDKLKQAGLPLKNLIALTPGTLQQPGFYASIHALGISTSYGTYTNLDLQDFNASQYRVLKAKGADMIATNKTEQAYTVLKQ